MQSVGLSSEQGFVPPELTEVQERAVALLQKDGVAAIPFAELFSDPARWAEVADDMAEFVAATERRLPGMSLEDRVEEYGKPFLVRRFRTGRGGRGLERRRAGLDDPWLRLGSSQEFLGIVNTYRGRLMRVNDLDNWYTIPDAAAEDRIASQRWHRDGWEDHIVKVFTYFSDVDEEAGPFEYVRSSTTGSTYGTLWPFEEREVYPDQEEFDRAIPSEDRLILTGPPGTIVFCDTSGFHRGGFARTKPRVLSYHTYISPTAEAGHKRLFDVDWTSGAENLPPASRFALE